MTQPSKLGRIWVFDENALAKALHGYEADSVKAYPQQEERIRIAVAAMRDFLYSDYADELTMQKKRGAGTSD
jgi:hypothetical protein